MRNNLKILIVLLTLTLATMSCYAERSISTTQPTTARSTGTVIAASRTIEPTITSTPIIEKEIGTRLNFTFPFEPSFPGYLVYIQSNTLSVELMCALDQDSNQGEAVELGTDADEWKVFGSCDTNSMTLDQSINEKITVTVILGGFPIINEATKLPDRITEQNVEFDFEYSFE